MKWTDKILKRYLATLASKTLSQRTIRIGQKDEDGMKWRPIKVILQSVSEKDRIMKSLYKLKQFDHVGLSITDDFTINEKKKIKEMHKKANNMNLGPNGDFVWCVSGSPRTNLRLVRKPRIKTLNKLSLTNSSDDWSDDD